MSYSFSQSHSFDIALAAAYGVEEAILIHHFQHWIRINTKAKRNLKQFPSDNGEKMQRYFTYQSRKEIQLHFPYWNYDRVKYLCEKLVNEGVLIALNFNKNPIDKTLWYAFMEPSKFGLSETQVDCYYRKSNNVYERENSPSIEKSAQPIPDTISSDTLKEEPPPTPPKGKEDWWRRFFSDKCSREEFERAWEEYLGEPIGSVKDVKKWLLHVMGRHKAESGIQADRICRINMHRAEANQYGDMARVKNLNTIESGIYGVQFVNGSNCEHVPYDLPDDKWKEATEAKFKLYSKRPGEK